MNNANPLVRRSRAPRTLAVALCMAGFVAGCSGDGSSVTPPDDVTRAIPVPAEKVVEAKKPAQGLVVPGKKGGPD